MEKKKKRDMEGVAFAGFMFLGFAISVFIGRWDTFPWLGLGLGFIAMFIVMFATRNN